MREDGWQLERGKHDERANSPVEDHAGFVKLAVKDESSGTHTCDRDPEGGGAAGGRSDQVRQPRAKRHVDRDRKWSPESVMEVVRWWCRPRAPGSDMGGPDRDDSRRGSGWQGHVSAPLA